MKTCCTCKTELSLDCFNKNKSKKDGLNSICKDCSKSRSKLYYKENTDHHKKVIRERSKLQIKKFKQYIDKVKEVGCLYCAESEICVLDFHHLESDTKEYTIAKMQYNSLKLVQKEIEKCVVLCSNCHRKLHAGKIILHENVQNS